MKNIFVQQCISTIASLSWGISLLSMIVYASADLYSDWIMTTETAITYGGILRNVNQITF